MPTDRIGLEYYIDLTKLNAGIKAVKSKIDILNKSIMAVPKGTAAPISGASAELKKMGITSGITTAQFQKMNFEVADHAKIAKLTRLQIKELENSMVSSGKATSQQAHQFNRLGKRLEHSEYQVRKQTSAMGDARRAQERWGAGFKYMMMSQAAWIASGAVIFGTLGAITQALRDFLDFNQGLVDAAAITQATSAGYKRMEKAAISAFKSSTMGIKETTEALKILGQAGMDATDAAIALETVYKVTTATGGGTTEVVKFLTTAINVWKLSAEDAAKVGNILGAALNYSKLEVEDLGVTFNYVASIAKTVGMSITELAATMAVMANAGIKASTIGTGLRGVMSKLISSSPKLEKELAKVGLTFGDVSLTTHSLMEALETLSKAGFDLKNIFTGLRRREAAALNVMLEQGVERFKLMTEALKDTTAIEVMFERSMKGMKNQLILTGHQIQAVLIDMLKVSQPVIIGIAKSIQALTAALRDLAPVLIGLGISFAAWKISAIIITAATAKLAAGFTAATIAAGIFGKVLMFIKVHPILTFLTLLVGGYTAVKAIIDATTISIKKHLSQLNREIDDTRKLQILLMDSNRTNEEKLRILADYAKDYPTLLKFLDQEKIKIEDITKLISEENKVRKKKILRLKQEELASLKTRLAYIEIAYGEDYDPSKESRLKRWLKLTGEDTKTLRNQIRLLNFEIAALEGKVPEIKLPPEIKPSELDKEALERLKETFKKNMAFQGVLYKIQEDLDKDFNKTLKDNAKALSDWKRDRFKKDMEFQATLYKLQEDLDKEFEKKKKDYDKRDFGAGMMEGLRKYRDLISDEYKIWEDMAYESAMAMQNSFSDLFFDAMMGDLHSLSDYWKAFTTSIKRMIANMASMWLMFSVFNMGGIGLASHQGGLIKAHSGGLIKKMHSGGQNLKSDETIRILKDHEYVIKDSSVRSIGVAALDFANKTGRLPQASQPQQVIHKHYTYVYAIDSESMDLALRKRGAGAIGDISLNANAYARGRQDPRVSGRGRY